MIKNLHFFIILICLIAVYNQTNAQSASLLKTLDKLQFGFYMDSYYSYDFDSKEDQNANQRLFSGIFPFNNEFRLNTIVLSMNYTDDDIRTKVALQFGDVPLIQTQNEKRFIKFLRNASFGVKIFDDFWLDFGYISDPIGVESSLPDKNYLSSVSVGGYCQPGNYLGFLLTYDISKMLKAVISYGNNYNLISENDINKSLGLSLQFTPSQNFTMAYCNDIGDESVYGTPREYYIYNNFYIVTKLSSKIEVTGQLDFAFQGNSKKDDSTGTASMWSGMIATRYSFSDKFSVSLRGEYYNDPDGFISQGAGGSGDHLKTWGGAVGVQFKPNDQIYFRLEYNYLESDQALFHDNRRYDRQNLSFNTGIRL